MSKIGKLFKALGQVIRKPYLLNYVLLDMEIRKEEVLSRHNFPKGLPQVNILSLFPSFSETVDPFCFLEGGSLPIDIALLKSFARQFPNCDYFEIGSWRGESLANVSSVASNCISLNLSYEEMKALGLKDDYINQHFLFSKTLPNVKHIGHNSLTFDFRTLNQKFDLIFIDGDHRYEAVKSDTSNAFKLLKNDKSVIVWHDYTLGTEKIRWDVLAGILDGCPADKRGNLYHVSNTLCAIYTSRKLPGKLVEYPSWPDKIFKVDIKTKPISG